MVVEFFQLLVFVCLWRWYGSLQYYFATLHLLNVAAMFYLACQIYCFLLAGSDGLAGDKASDKLCLPTSDRQADEEDSQDLGADPTQPTI